MRVLDGKEVSELIQKQIEEDLRGMKGYIPKLAVICAGKSAEKLAYEKSIIRNFEKRQLKAEAFEYSGDISNEEFLAEVRKLDDREDIDGILILSPLPPNLNEQEAIQLISPEKDIEGRRIENRGRCFLGDFTGFIPCTAVAVMELLRYAEVPLKGRRVVVIGCGKNVGIPLISLLMEQMATVSVCHLETGKETMLSLCREADVVISATGHAGLINASHIKKGAAVIDVGISIDERGEICGDVVFHEVIKTASVVTPVPGGVGTVTRAVAARALVKAAGLRKTWRRGGGD